MNSEDVYNDVKYIWENCYKYNNKGDYIVELMKRVKKNFAKYWTAAELYSKQPQVNSGELLCYAIHQLVHMLFFIILSVSSSFHGLLRHLISDNKNLSY